MSFDPAQRFAQLQSRLAPATDCFRVIDATPHQFAGNYLDYLSGTWLLSTASTRPAKALLDFLAARGEPVYHKVLSQDQKQPPVLIMGHAASAQFVVKENNLKFLLDMQSGYSQGIFLDQRDNRRKLADLLSSGKTLLNTFSYTGAFSVYGAAKGAVTTTLDLAQPCLDWAKRNFELNGLDPSQHYFCKGDTLHWLERFAKQQRRFDAIVLDPPSFSRNKSGGIWRVEKDYSHLAALAAACLQPGGTILCSTNLKKLAKSEFMYMLQQGLGNDFSLQPQPMCFDFNGLDYLKVVFATRRF